MRGIIIAVCGIYVIGSKGVRLRYNSEKVPTDIKPKVILAMKPKEQSWEAKITGNGNTGNITGITTLPNPLPRNNSAYP